MFLTHYDSKPILDRLFHGEHGGHLTPPVDIVQKDDAWICSLDLPGVRLNDIDIKVQGNTLTVSAQRVGHNNVDDDRYTYHERSFGSFQRVFTLPTDANPEEISARSTDGVLEIRIARRKDAEGRKIEVLPVDSDVKSV